MSRVKIKKKVFGSAQLVYTEEDLRFGTPEVVADYRAERLKCEVIADLGCSVGFQALAFSKTCKKVYAVELDAGKLKSAQKNAQIMDRTNIEFISGDALDPQVIKKLTSCEIIFCDTERPMEEKERKLTSLRPSPLELIKKYSKITPNLGLEVPPYLKDIPFACEREYLSVERKLNRLNLYLGELKKAEKSVVLLPEKIRLEYRGLKPKRVKSLNEKYHYLYEINPAVVQAELFGEVGENLELFTFENKFYFVSFKLINSPWLRPYQILAQVGREFTSIHAALEEIGAKSVVLRQRIDPTQYWTERKKYETGLKGTKKVHLFLFEKAVIAEEIKNSW